MLRDRLESDEGKSRDPAGSVEPLVGPEASYVHVQSSIQDVSKLETAGIGWNSESAASTGGASFAARSRRSEDLLVDLAPELVRGVPLGNIMRRFGTEWRQSTAPDALRWRPQLSKEIQRYTYFFSHDWQTSWWMKYLSLVIYFNGRAAAIATFLFSVFFGILGLLEIVPLTIWWTILGHVLGLLVLFFWQHVRELGCNARFCFMDRLCIPQDDPEKKSQCIYGLASFLNKSDYLVVLWSPSYFSRLWCMYEVACFLMRRKEAHRIKFLPVQISILWFLIYFAVATTWLTVLIAQRYGSAIFTWNEITGKVNLAFVMALQVFILYPPIFYLTNEMLHDMAQLPRELQQFDIETAKCFCCSNGHVHPATGEHIECDRKLIYGVLHWWSGSSGVEEDGVEQIQRVFKSHMDRHLMHSVERTFTHSGFLLRPLMFAAAMGSFPFMADFIGKEGGRLVTTWFIKMKFKMPPFRNAVFVIYILFWIPLFVRLILLLGNMGQRYWQSSGRKCVLILIQILSLFVISLICIMAYMVSIFIGSTKLFSPLGALPLYMLGLMLISSVIAVRHLCCQKSVMIGGTPKERRDKKPVEAAEEETDESSKEPEMTAYATIRSEGSEETSFGI